MIKKIASKYTGAIFYGLLIIVNYFTKFCPEINSFFDFHDFPLLSHF